MSGEWPPVGVRPIVVESWERALRAGVDPERGAEPAPEPEDEVERWRARSPIAGVLDVLRGGLVSLADDGVHIMVVTDEEGRLMWREGKAAVLTKADSTGLVEGVRWDEANMGTNAVGTTLVLRRPMQIFAAEHFVRTQHSWICSAAPLYDPVDGRLLGIVAVSGPAATGHPNTLALVAAVTELAEISLRTAHEAALDRLRTVAAPVLAGMGVPALVTDRDGWVAAAVEFMPPRQVVLPERMDDGQGYVPSIGWCRLEPLYDGWVISVAEPRSGQATSLVLDLRRGATMATVVTGSGVWRHRLSPRHAEILRILARHPEGRTAAELSVDLFGNGEHIVAVRAEMSRLRRRLGSVIEPRPYRFSSWLDVFTTSESPIHPEIPLTMSATPCNPLPG